MSFSHFSSLSVYPTHYSTVTTGTPPFTTINSLGYPTPQQVPLGYGYSSHQQGHDHVLQQPDPYYQWSIDYPHQQWNPQLNHQYNYLPHQPHPSQQPQLAHQQPNSQSKNLQEVSRQHRLIYTNAQLAMLKERFRKNMYISKMECVELGKIIGVSEQQVKVWFNNRRQKAKKSKLQ